MSSKKVPAPSAAMDSATSLRTAQNDKPDDDEINLAIIERHETNLAADTAARQMARLVGYDLPNGSTNPDLICFDIASNMRRSVEAVLDIGRGLLVLKAACQHGEFMQRLEALQFDHTAAKRFMRAARKFSNSATSHHLLPKIDSTSKLYELLVLDDDQIEELVETGKTGELALDDIACMGVSELRKKLREANADLKARKQVIDDKDKRINDLTEKKIKREQESDRHIHDPAADTIKAIENAVSEHNKAIGVWRQQAGFLKEAIGESPRYLSVCQASLIKMMGDIRDAAQAFGIAVFLSPDNLSLTPAETGQSMMAEFEEYERQRAAAAGDPADGNGHVYDAE